MGLFKRKSPQEKLQKKYKKLLEDFHRLSSIDRKKADAALAESEEVMKEIERLNQSDKGNFF
jgi:chaperonin cofactor prefoldin